MWRLIVNKHNLESILTREIQASIYHGLYRNPSTSIFIKASSTQLSSFDESWRNKMLVPTRKWSDDEKTKSVLHLQQCRQFSKRIGMRPPRQGVQMPASATPRQIKIALPSPGVIGEPYRGRIKIPLVEFLTLEGWKKFFRFKILGTVKSIYTLAKCRTQFQWRMLTFKQDTLVMYEKICVALAKGDLRELRQLVTPTIYSQMKGEIGRRGAGGWHNVEWALVGRPTLRDVQVLQARLIGDPKQEEMAFAQITMLIPSVQKFAAFARNGKLVAGNLEDHFKVKDFWVFERCMKKDSASASWRLAARLPDPSENTQSP